MPRFRELDSPGTIWWKRYLSGGPGPINVDLQSPPEEETQPSGPTKFDELIGLMDLVKFRGLGEYERSGETETFRCPIKITQLPSLSLEVRNFLMQESGEEEVEAIFGYNIRDRVISLKARVRGIEFVLDKGEGTCRVVRKELKEEKWVVSGDSRLEDLTNPTAIAKAGVEIAQSIGGSGSS